MTADTAQPSSGASTLVEINQLLGSVNILLPVAALALTKLFDLFRRDNPEVTFDQFIETIRTEAAQTKDLVGDRLRAMGYEQDAAGAWARPDPSPQP